MKSIYVANVLNGPEGVSVKLLGWIASLRKHKTVIFASLEDSSGKIQVEFPLSSSPDLFDRASQLQEESSVEVTGMTKKHKKMGMVVVAGDVAVIGEIRMRVNPAPRKAFDISHQKYTDNVLSKRHLYIRNAKLKAIIEFRNMVVELLRSWFKENKFTEITTPAITQVPLYHESSAFHIDYFGSKAYLSQCAAFYLEAAMPAFERVYTIGPSFRAEDSKSRRHLAEYWHIKAEIAFADFEDMAGFCERMIAYVASNVDPKALEYLKEFCKVPDAQCFTRIPFPRIDYDAAVNKLRDSGKVFQWGKNFGMDEIKMLASEQKTPFWITLMPKEAVPYPYMTSANDPRTTMTADLIGIHDNGEILGIAQKITETDKLVNRMQEKGIVDLSNYEWYIDLTRFGVVPHSGFGMGLERLIKMLLGLEHVRDAIPFPRLFARRPTP
jgi:asparaginyl-tRNA synthetase